MCKFEQNISNDVKKNNKILCKIKNVIYQKYKSYKSHVSICHILNVREHCKIPNAKVQIRCFHFVYLPHQCFHFVYLPHQCNSMPASLGKFNHSFNPIGEGDVVLILDKVKHTLPV